MQKSGPALREIDEGVASLSELRDKPAGTIRISADEFAVHHVLWPAIAQLAPEYPDISFEITTDYGLTDIVSGRYDAGVLRGGLVSQDMVAVRISPDIRMAVVASPIYLRNRQAPHTPQDLTAHSCINLRLPTHGEYFAWTFRKGSKEHRVKVAGQFVFNTLSGVHAAVLSGFGLAYLPEERAMPDLKSGALVEVLANWRQTFEGYHLYYPHRRHPSPRATRRCPKEEWGQTIAGRVFARTRYNRLRPRPTSGSILSMSRDHDWLRIASHRTSGSPRGLAHPPLPPPLADFLSSSPSCPAAGGAIPRAFASIQHNIVSLYRRSQPCRSLIGTNLPSRNGVLAF